MKCLNVVAFSLLIFCVSENESVSIQTISKLAEQLVGPAQSETLDNISPTTKEDELKNIDDPVKRSDPTATLDDLFDGEDLTRTNDETQEEQAEITTQQDGKNEEWEEFPITVQDQPLIQDKENLVESIQIEQNEFAATVRDEPLVQDPEKQTELAPAELSADKPDKSQDESPGVKQSSFTHQQNQIVTSNDFEQYSQTKEDDTTAQIPLSSKVDQTALNTYEPALKDKPANLVEPIQHESSMIVPPPLFPAFSIFYELP